MSTIELEPEVSTKKAKPESLFEIVVNRDALLAEISVAADIVEDKTTIPILTNFLFVADGNGVTVTATDLERSIMTPVPARVKKPGSVTIPARKLYDYVRLLAPGSELTLKTLENHWVQIRAGRSNTKMVGMARANYPQVPEIGDLPVIKLPVHALKILIAQTLFAISKDESRYTLNGALLGIEPEKLYMVATDGHRLAKSERTENVKGVAEPFTILVPGRAIKDVNAMMLATEASEVTFARNANTIFFVIGHRQYTSRRMSGSFPNYEAVIPRENNNFCVMRVSEVENAIRRVATFADEHSGAIKLSISVNSLLLSAASTENGESEDSVETTYDKGPIVIGFNADFILDFLKVLGGKGEIRIGLKDGQSSCLMQPEVEDPETNLLYVLMPMRI